MLRRTVLQTEDVAAAATRAFRFLTSVFSVRVVELQTPVKPKRTNTALVNVVWGIKSIDRSAASTDPFSDKKGIAVYDERFDVRREATQSWILAVCEVRGRSGAVLKRCCQRRLRDLRAAASL